MVLFLCQRIPTLFSFIGLGGFILFVLFECWANARTQIQLTPHALILRGPTGRGTRWIPLERIVKLTVVQNRLDRWMRTGRVQILFRGSRTMALKAIPEPFEVWKRIKRARFENKKAS